MSHPSFCHGKHCYATSKDCRLYEHIFNANKSNFRLGFINENCLVSEQKVLFAEAGSYNYCVPTLSFVYINRPMVLSTSF